MAGPKTSNQGYSACLRQPNHMEYVKGDHQVWGIAAVPVSVMHRTCRCLGQPATWVDPQSQGAGFVKTFISGG